MALVAGSAALGTGLSSAVYTQMTGLGYFSANAAGQAFCDALAAAIVPYLTANASVIPTALVAPGGGGPVVGTGTIL